MAPPSWLPLSLLIIATFNSAEQLPSRGNFDIPTNIEALMQPPPDEAPPPMKRASKKTGLRSVQYIYHSTILPFLITRLSVSNNIDVLRAKLFNGVGSSPSGLLLPRIKQLRYGKSPRKMKMSRRKGHTRYFRGSPNYSEFKRNTRLMWRSKMPNFVNPNQIPIHRLG